MQCFSEYFTSSTGQCGEKARSALSTHQLCYPGKFTEPLYSSGYLFLELEYKYLLVGLFLEKAMAPHSSTLAWKIPWMEEPGRLQSMGSLRVRHDFHFSLSRSGEGNGNPLQCSCLENPRDGGAWWAAIYGVAQSQTQLKRLSSSSSNPHEKTSRTTTTESQEQFKLPLKPKNTESQSPIISMFLYHQQLFGSL